MHTEHIAPKNELKASTQRLELRVVSLWSILTRLRPVCVGCPPKSRFARFNLAANDIHTGNYSYNDSDSQYDLGHNHSELPL